MSLTVLSVAYPFAPVDADPVGGAEQVLARLDRAVVEAGARSVVIAQEGSKVAGELLAVPRLEGEIGSAGRAATYHFLRRRLRSAIETVRPDVVHLHGVDFHHYLPGPGEARAPVMVTLHLPLDWYPEEARTLHRADVSLTPVSADQVRRGPAVARMTDPIENGVDVERFRPGVRKRGFALSLGRICPEKGFHHALDAARALDMPLVLAGSVFPYPEHQRYFAEEIAPRLDARRRWLGPVVGEAKRRLIAAARCLVVASLVPETSSLVAREALACGTPVAALRNGALADALEPGVTGALAETPCDLAQAMAEAVALDGAACRRSALARFDARCMAARYLKAYRRLAAASASPLPQAA